jgi:AcrR family transcriptional regulator
MPARERGIQRFSRLLDATDELLGEYHVDDIGLYGIAERAGVPPASVYHFFPTVEAAFHALAQRYLQGFMELFAEPVESSAFSNWLDLMARDQRLSVSYFSAHPAAMKLFLGRYGGEETRKADIEFNRRAGKGLWYRLNAAFQMPNIEGAAEKFTNMLFIQDALWSAGYAASGAVSAECLEESRRACHAYLRLYFPQQIVLRPEVVAMVAQGGTIDLENLTQMRAKQPSV